jgi:hypothetical protein
MKLEYGQTRHHQTHARVGQYRRLRLTLNRLMIRHWYDLNSRGYV